LAFWEERQSGVCENVARTLSQWLEERRADAEILASLPSVKALLGSKASGAYLPTSSVSLRDQIAGVLDRFASVYGYRGVFVLNREGSSVARSARAPDLEEDILRLARVALEEQRLRIELVGENPAQTILVYCMPVRDVDAGRTGGKDVSPILGTIVLQISMADGVFPLLTAVPVSSRTGETLLVRREGNQTVFISPLRHAAQRTTALRLSNRDTAAWAALERGETAGSFLDYRGVPVIAAARKIPLTGWGLVRKIDRREALAEVDRMSVWKIGFGVLVILLGGGLLWEFRRRRMARALEEGLRRIRARLKLQAFAQEIVDNAPAGLLVLSHDFRVLSANRSFLEIFALTQEDVLNKPLDAVIHAENPPYRAAGPFEDSLVPGTVLLDIRVGNRPEKRPVRMTIKEFAPEEGKERKLLFIEDLTSSERLRAAAEASEQRLRDLVQNLEAIVWEADPQTLQFTFVSQRAEQILGFPISAWLSEANFLSRHIHPDDREPILAEYLQAASTGSVRELEYRMVAADGHTVWLRDQVRAMKGPSGLSGSLRGVMLDITEHKRAEEERARLSSAVEQAAEAILMTHPDGTIVYVNPAFEKVSGYRREEVLGQNPRLLKSGKHPPEFYQEMWGTLARGEAWRGRFINRRKDGTYYEVDTVITPVRDRTEQVVYYVSVQRDMTRERQLEEQFRQAQKMEAVGRLAGGVAHDFNNLLTIINGFADILTDRLGRDHPEQGHVNEIRKAGERAASLTRQLLAFSRRQVLAPQVLDLNAVVSNMEKMLRRLIGEDVDLVTVPGRDLGRVLVDPGQIEQIVLNLAINARDAMPQGGKLTIATANARLDESYALGHFPVRPGDYVMLSVSDTGCGMDAETQAHLFEPFFTTKETGKGTGLGLATVYGIVKQSGGYVWAYSEVGRGTTFNVYFPAVEAPARVLPSAPARPVLQRGSETILLVEDEGSLRSLVHGILVSSGYKVLQARDGEDALRVAEQHKGPIHLLLTDVVMPGLGGRELAEHLAPFQRTMKVLYFSGYTDDAILHHGVLEPGTNFLQKPFRPDDLVQKVRQVLDGRPDPSS
jgi:PAS domain S-box-containing protein